MLVAIGAVAILVAQASPTWAQSNGAHAPPPSAIDYNDVFQKGLDAYDAGNTGVAIDIWEHLLATLGEERGYKISYNLGLAYQKLGDATHAVERMTSFANRAALDARRDASLEERRQDALDRVRAIKASLGALHVAAAPEGSVALVRVGAAEPRPAGFLVYLAPGEHEVELYAGTSRARRVRVTLVAGATKEVPLDPPPPLPPSSPPENGPPAQQAMQPSSAASASFPTPWLIGGLAVTVASCAVPLVLALDASAKRDDALAQGSGSATYGDAMQRFDAARTRYEISWALPGALALTTAAVVVVLMVVDRRRGDRASGPVWTRVSF